MDNALLDTHVFIWFMLETKNIKQEVIDKINEYNNLYISPITIWEIALLHKKNKIQFNFELGDWIRKSIKSSGIKVANCNDEILIGSVRISSKFHNDPADRIIISTARELQATLFTRDKKIIEFSQSGFIDCEEV